MSLDRPSIAGEFRNAAEHASSRDANLSPSICSTLNTV